MAPAEHHGSPACKELGAIPRRWQDPPPPVLDWPPLIRFDLAVRAVEVLGESGPTWGADPARVAGRACCVADAAMWRGGDR